MQAAAASGEPVDADDSIIIHLSSAFQFELGPGLRAFKIPSRLLSALSPTLNPTETDCARLVDLVTLEAPTAPR